jgi:hypothetical protein
MARLNLIIPKGNVPNWLKSIFLTIQTWARNISGDCLVDGSVVYSKLALASRVIPAGKVNWPEWHIPLALPAVDVATTDTEYARCSGVFLWDPLIYPITGGSWYFEASLAIDDAAGIVTARLMGSAEIATVTRTGETTMDLVRSTALTMPTTTENLYVELKTSNASYIGSFSGARLVFVPT